MASGKFLNRYFMDWSLALFSPCHCSVYPSGSSILSNLPCDGLPCLFRLYARCGRALHALAPLSVVARHYRVFPAYVDTFADLFQWSAAHQTFHQLFFGEGTGFQLTIVSSFSSPFSDGSEENTCVLERSSIGCPSSSRHFR